MLVPGLSPTESAAAFTGTWVLCSAGCSTTAGTLRRARTWHLTCSATKQPEGACLFQKIYPKTKIRVTIMKNTEPLDRKYSCFFLPPLLQGHPCNMDLINGSETALQNYKFKMLLEKPPHDSYYVCVFFFFLIIFKTNFKKSDLVHCSTASDWVGSEYLHTHRQHNWQHSAAFHRTEEKRQKYDMQVGLKQQQSTTGRPLDWGQSLHLCLYTDWWSSSPPFTAFY